MERALQARGTASPKAREWAGGSSAVLCGLRVTGGQSERGITEISMGVPSFPGELSVGEKPQPFPETFPVSVGVLPPTENISLGGLKLGFVVSFQSTHLCLARAFGAQCWGTHHPQQPHSTLGSVLERAGGHTVLVFCPRWNPPSEIPAVAANGLSFEGCLFLGMYVVLVVTS